MGRRGVVALWMFVAWTLSACLSSQTEVCGDGRVCPGGQVCVRFGCVLPSQVTACMNMPDGTVCTLPGDDTGECHENVCVSIGCGNGVVETGEACDDGNTLGGDGCSARCDSDESCGNAFLDTAKSEGCDCGDADFTGTRPPACGGKPNSDAADAVCTSSCQIRGCGDGVVGGLEDCDGSALTLTNCSDVGFYQGTLSCLPSCRYDVSACTGRCGDGTRNGSPIELCDGDDLGDRSCQDFGYYDAAGLECNSLCGFDTSGCTGYCGDNTYQVTDEICDPGESEAQLNGRGLNCTQFGFYLPGGLGCSDACQIDTSQCGGGFCGDGTQDPLEDCDNLDLDEKTCASFGYYEPDGLGCRGNCTFDFTSCSQRCGDLTVNGPESCDGSVPPGTDCTDFGYYQAPGLTCTAACGLDTSGCSQKCGDGTKNGTEQCDGSVPAGLDCTDFGYYSGNVTCSAGCTYDISACTGRCGDGIINGPSEVCDGAALGGNDCLDLGYYNAPGLACSGTCNFDASSCTGFCGDSVINGGEDCDGTPPNNTCLELGYDGGRVGCSHFCTPAVDRCERFGWWAVSPPAPGLRLNAVAGTAHTNVFALSDDKLFRYDGTSWVQQAQPIGSCGFIDIWLASATGLWAAGGCKGVWQYNGTTWTNNSPNDIADATYWGIWGSSTSNVFAVGGTSSSGIISRFNGTTWSSTTLGSVPFNDAWGSSGTNVIVVGSFGSAYHFNGSTWSPMTTGTTNHINAVWGTSATNVWAVGDGGTILRYDGNGGNTWTTVASGTTFDLRGIWGSNATHVFAVGDAMLFYDGTVWLPLQTRVTAMNDVWGSDPNNVWGVGGVSLAYFGGQSVRQTSTGITDELRGVWMANPNDAFAVGDNGVIRRYDGTSWSGMSINPATTDTLFTVWGSSSSNVFAGGVNGLILRWTAATSWAPVTSNTTGYVRGIWGVDQNNAFAVAQNGDVVRWNGSTWTATALPIAPGGGFSAVWGRSMSDVYAVGFSEEFRHFDGNTWSKIAGGIRFANAIAGFGIDLLVAHRYRHDGTTWFLSSPPLESLSSPNAKGMWARGPRDVFAVGDLGQLGHFDGLGWLPVRTGTTANLNAVSGSGESAMLVGAGGTAVELQSFCGTTELKCTNQWDDDCDGKLNCADPDCSADAWCAAGGACSGWKPITCGANVAGTNKGGNRIIDGYGCSTSQYTPGTEVAYRFVAPATQSVTVTVTKSDFLDLAVVADDQSGACEPHGGCIGAFNTNSGGTPDVVTFNATAGQVYYFIVDGQTASVVAPFTLQVTCN